jgi:signal transduction histidine kinase
VVLPVQGTRWGLSAATMGSMSGGSGHWSRWAQVGRRAVGARQAPMAGCLLLAVLAVVQSVAQRTPSVQPPGLANQTPQLFLILIALATTLPLGFLWSQPRAAAVVIWIANLLSLVLVHAFTAAGLIAMVLVVYRLGHERRWLLATGIGAAFLGLALAEPANHATTRMVLIVLAAATPFAAWAGYARLVRGESVALSAETEAIAGSLLEHTARGERARISRELHDVVAHHISMIAVQAETARLTTPGMPAVGAQRLSAIGDTARSALTEMRRLLGVLREDTRYEPGQRRPQPGLDQINELLDEARDAAGTGTRLIISGWLTALDPGVELAAYRIIQEALTNSRRHAPGAAVDVELRYERGWLHVKVRDNGPGPASEQPAGGHGLLGMRERAVAVGGTLRTGMATGGGFVVEATLPASAEQDAA